MSFSHAETVVFLTFRISPSSFCVKFFVSLSFFNLIPNSFINTFYKKYGIFVDIPKNME